MKFKCFDLETTGVDVETAEVVQAAAVEAVLRTSHLQPQWYRVHVGTPSFVIGEATTQLFYVASIPEGATAVHGIRVEDVVDMPKFGACVDSFTRSLIAPDVVTVSFNGTGYDIPIIARYVSQFGVTRSEWETRLRLRHIDVMRLWARARQAQRPAPVWEALTADLFIGGLMSAHAFWIGEKFDGAHDAGADCVATLRVLDEMLSSGFCTIDDAIRWSNEPLPGDVDFAGKFKWQGERVVITIGKQAGTPIEKVERGFLQWMLGKDFHSDTKDIVRRFLAGEYPVRKYEDET